jgi:hypothetical protein
MADEQPGAQDPAAGPPLRREPAADRTRVESGESERSTVDAPVRWSGSAAVPPAGPKRPWWSRRRPAAGPPDRGGAAAAETDWAATPAVDPWAGQDTPWDPMQMIPPAELPPTRMEPPLPPTRLEPPPVAAPPVPPPVAAPPAPPAPRRGWRAKKPAPTAPVNRVPVAARPPAPPTPPVSRPAPPPSWRPPTAGPRRPPPPPPRRRRHWGRRFALFTLFGVACCCGLPVTYFAWAPARQYPVRAVLPASFSDLNLRDDNTSRRAVARLTQELTDANAHVDQVFAGVYGDGNGKRVTVFGTTGFRLTPGSDVGAELNRLTREYDIRGSREFSLGEAGAHERCGAGQANGASVVVCVWADHGSLATVLTTRRSVADSAALTALLRTSVLTHRVSV